MYKKSYWQIIGDLIGNKIADKTIGVSKKSSKEWHLQNEDKIEKPK